MDKTALINIPITSHFIKYIEYLLQIRNCKKPSYDCNKIALETLLP